MQNRNEYDLFNLYLLGNDAALKNAILARFLLKTTADLFESKTVELGGQLIKLQVSLDIPRINDQRLGISRSNMVPGWTDSYHTLKFVRHWGFMLAYNANDKTTFDEIGRWLVRFKEVEEHESKQGNNYPSIADHKLIPKILVGNFDDLAGEKQVSSAEAEAFAKEHGMKFIEISAKTGRNVEEAFLTLTKEFYSRKLQQNLIGHSEAVTTLAVDLANNILVSGSADKTIKVWELKKNQCLQTLAGHSGVIHALAYANNQLVSGSADKTIKLWDLKKKKCEATLKGHTDTVQALTFFENNTQLASASVDKTIKLWDLKKKKCFKTLAGHEGAISALVLINNAQLASGSADGSIKIWRLWNTEDYPCTATLIGHHGAVNALAVFVVNGVPQLVSAGADGTIKFWDTETYQCLQTLTSHYDPVHTLLFFANDTLLASRSLDGRLKIWNTKIYRCLETLTKVGATHGLVALSNNKLANASGKNIELFFLSGYENQFTNEIPKPASFENKANPVSTEEKPKPEPLIKHSETVSTVPANNILRIVSNNSIFPNDENQLTKKKSNTTLEKNASLAPKPELKATEEPRIHISLFILGKDVALNQKILAQFLLRDKVDNINYVRIEIENRQFSFRFFIDSLRTFNKYPVRGLTALGRDQHRAVRIPSVNGFMFVYDVNEKTTFEEVAEWLKLFKQLEHDDSIPKLLVGNNDGLVGENAVSTAEAEAFAKEHGMEFCEISVSSGFNIKEVFLILVKQVHDLRLHLPITLKGHSEAVTSLAVVNNTLISGSMDNAIKLWDAPKAIASQHYAQTMQDHRGAVHALAPYAKGARLASGSTDKTIKLWELEKNKCETTLKGHTNTIHALLLFENDNRLASASADKTIKLWDLKKNKCFKTLMGHDGSVSALALVNNTHLASGSADGTIKIWQLWITDTYPCMATLIGHDGAIHALAVVVVNDASLLVSGGADGTIKFWDSKTYQCVQTLKGHFSPVHALLTFANNKLLASSSSNGEIKMWDTKTYQCLNTLKKEGATHGLAEFSNRLASISGKDIRLFSLSSYETQLTNEIPKPASVENKANPVSKEDTALASTEEKPIPKPLIKHSETVSTVPASNTLGNVSNNSAFHSEENQLIKKKSNTTTQNNTSLTQQPELKATEESRIPITLFMLGKEEALNQKILARFLLRNPVYNMDYATIEIENRKISFKFFIDSLSNFNKAPVRGMTALGRDGHRAVHTLSINGFMFVYDVNERTTFEEVAEWLKLFKKLGHDDSIPKLLVGNNDGLIGENAVSTAEAEAFAKEHSMEFCEISVSTGANIKEIFLTLTKQVYNIRLRLLEYLEGHDKPVTSLAVINGLLISGSVDNTIRLWDPQKTLWNKQYQLQTLEGHSGPVHALAAFANGTRLVSGSADKTIKIWDLKNNKCLQTFTDHSDTVHVVIVFANDTLMVSGSADQNFKLWQIKKNKCLKTFTDHSGTVHALAAFANGTRLVSSSADKTIKIWDTKTYECLQTLTGHNGAVYALLILANDTRLVSCSEDRTIKVWDLTTYQCLKTLTDHKVPVYSLVALDRTRFVSNDLNHSIKFWDSETYQCLETRDHQGRGALVALSSNQLAIAKDKIVRLLSVSNYEPQLINTISTVNSSENKFLPLPEKKSSVEITSTQSPEKKQQQLNQQLSNSISTPSKLMEPVQSTKENTMQNPENSQTELLERVQKNDHTLTSLVLRNLTLIYEEKFMKALCINHTVLSLEFNKANKDRTKTLGILNTETIISQLIGQNRSLTSIVFDNFYIFDGDWPAEQIIKALERNFTLLSCEFRDYSSRKKDIGEKFKKTIDELINRNNKLRDELHLAAKQGNLSKVQTLVTKGVSLLSTTGVDNNTPLHWAVLGEKAEVVAWLVQEMNKIGLSLISKNKPGKTAQELAATRPLLANLFITKSAPPLPLTPQQQRDKELLAIIMQAKIDSNNLERIKVLISNGANLEITDTKFGRTPLIWAAYYGHTELVKFLESKKANIHAKDNEGNTALMNAARYGHQKEVEYLLSKGAKLKGKNKEGNTALLLATGGGLLDLLKYLLSKETDPEKKIEEINAALFFSINHDGRLEIMKYLFSQITSLKIKNNEGQTVLQFAISKNWQKEALIEMLEENHTIVEYINWEAESLGFEGQELINAIIYRNNEEKKPSKKLIPEVSTTTKIMTSFNNAKIPSAEIKQLMAKPTPPKKVTTPEDLFYLGQEAREKNDLKEAKSHFKTALALAGYQNASEGLIEEISAELNQVKTAIKESKPPEIKKPEIKKPPTISNLRRKIMSKAPIKPEDILQNSKNSATTRSPTVSAPQSNKAELDEMQDKSFKH